MEPIIEFENFTFKYRSQMEPTLRDINLKIYPGEKVLIIGPSGSGKSTLSNCINGLIPFSYEGDSTGTLKIEGKDPKKLGIFGLSKMVGTVLQDTDGQFIGLTVAEDIAFVLENDCMAQEEMFRKVDGVAETVEVKELLHHAPSEMSGGQKQRVAIARALANDPKVLLCDEATSALDPNTTHAILTLIKDINKKLGITVVVITHQMSVVKEICTHVAILDEGRVAESGLVGTVFAAPKSAAGRRLVFPGGADAQVYDPAGEKLVRLVFKDAATTSIPMIAQLASEEGILCNVISASTQKLSETVYGSMMLGIPSNQFDKAVAFLHNVANVQVEEVE